MFPCPQAMYQAEIAICPSGGLAQGIAQFHYIAAQRIQ